MAKNTATTKKTDHESVTQDISLTQGRILGPLARAPIVLSYGMGVDSTAILVMLHQYGIVPDSIIFAQVGNEKRETNAYFEYISGWLRHVGFPDLTVVQYRMKKTAKYNPYITLAGNCLANRTLPSLAFGLHGCSLKWKGERIDDEVKRQFGDCGVYRLIGYDASPTDVRRFWRTMNGSGSKARPNDQFFYPLIEAGLERQGCIDLIESAGLMAPPKSSCTFCPAMKPDEIRELDVDYLIEIVIIEANAAPSLQKIAGLWRKKKMSDFIHEEGLLPSRLIDDIWARFSIGKRVLPPDRETLADIFLQETIANYMSEYGLAAPATVCYPPFQPKKLIQGQLFDNFE
jgi:hypothetical protein